MPKHISLPEKDLRDKYLIKKLSLQNIADEFGVTVPCIITNFKKYGIEIRNLSESHKGQHSSPKTQFKKGHIPYNYKDLPISTIIDLYVNQRKSSVEIGKIYNIGHKSILKRLRDEGVEILEFGYFNRGKIHTKETREKFSKARIGKQQPQLQTIEARKKSRIKRLEVYKNGKYGWYFSRQKMIENNGTDSEIYFDHLLIENNITNYKREYIVKTGTRRRYSLDFAFPDIKLNIEIDGSSHIIRKEKDLIRDNYLISLGWNIIRVTDKDLFNKSHEIIENIKNILVHHLIY